MITFPDVPHAIAYCEDNAVYPSSVPEFEANSAYINVCDEDGQSEQIFYFPDAHVAVELYEHYNPWY